MGIKVRYKILIFWFVSIFLALVLLGIISSYMTYSLHEETTRKQIQEGFQLLHNQLQSRKKHLLRNVQLLAGRNDVVASASLIHNYQNINRYQPIIFDVEKQKLGRILERQLGLDQLDLISIYDANLNISSFVIKIDDRNVYGIQSYENSKAILLTTNDPDDKYSKAGQIPSLIQNTLPVKDDMQAIAHLHAVGSILVLEVTSPIIRQNYAGKKTLVGFIKVIEHISDDFLNKIGLQTNLQLDMTLSIAEKQLHASGLHTSGLHAPELHTPVSEPVSGFINNWQFHVEPKYFSGTLLYPIKGKQSVQFVFSAKKVNLSAELKIFRQAMIVALLLIALILIPFGIIFLRRNISMPVSELVKGVNAIKDGRYEGFSVASRGDEFSFLAASFDQMASAIDDRESALRKSEAQTRLILDSIAEGIFGIDQNSLCTFANPAAVRLLGYSNISELLGKNMHELMHHTYTNGKNYPISECPICVVNKTGKGEHSDNDLFWRKDKSSFAVEYWSHPAYLEGEVIGVVVAFYDITQRKKTELELEQYRCSLELMVEERTLDLETANKELEAFSYSVSHDLRAPLRGIDGFGQMLIEDYGESLDEIALDYIERIRNSTHRMSDLIDDLLNLSRISRKKMVKSKVNITELAIEVLDQLHSNEPERDVKINVESGLFAIGDSRLLRICLENLLGNAWKYSSKTKLSVIEVGVVDQNGDTVFYIRDNGAGFDMSYIDKLFGAFQRLHGKEYEGTGIGLATVQRIIHRHGGRVWAEAKIGEGASFYFTLPAN